MFRALLFMLFFPVFAFSQSFRFTHLDQHQGLSQNTVTAVLRDSEGLIWLGTQDGLNLFDGYTFKSYFYSRTDTNSVSDNYILQLAEDHQGRIWIGTRNGICFYDKKLARFFRFYFSPDERSDYHNSIASLQVLNNGEVLYRTKNNQVSLKIITDKEAHPVIQPTVRNSDPKETELYLLGEQIRLNQVKKEMICTNSSGTEFFRYAWQNSSHNFFTVKADSVHLFLIDSTTVKLVNWKEKNPEAKTVFNLHTFPTCLLLDRQGLLWIGTADGLYIISDAGKSSQREYLLRTNQSNLFSLSSSQIQSLYQSDDGLIWVGSVGGGVDIYDPLQNDFRVQLSAFSDGLSHGPVWMNYAFGNYLLASSSTTVQLFHPDGRTPGWWKSVPASKFYTAAFLDQNGWLWLGTRNEGLVVIDTVSGKPKQVPGSELLIGKQVMDIQAGPDRSIWFCTVSGIFRSNPAHDRIEMFNQGQGKSFADRSYFSAIRFDKSGNTWIASNKGLVKIENGTQRIQSFENHPGDTNSLSYNILNDICIDSKNRIWVSTISGGFDLFVPEQNSFINYSMQDGLPNNAVYAIEEDAEGKLWLSTNAGIVCFDPDAKTFLQFTTRDGLPSNEFVIHAHEKDANGRIYFGSADGLVSFLPQKISKRSVFSKPILTQLMVNYVPAELSRLQNLSHNERNISLEFTLVDYRFQDKIRYAYQLSGFDSEWRENTSENRVATYTNLPYGDYIFRVRFKTSGGQWSNSMLEIPIHIQTPFWATWWFRITGSILLIVILAFFIRYLSQVRLRKRLRELELAGKIQKEKERISRDLHDNVGAQLTYIISSLDHVSYRLEQGKEIAPAQKKVDDISDYARYTMQQLRESIWAINSESIRLSEILSRLQEHLQVQSEYQEQVKVQTERTGEDLFLPPAVSIEIFRILQEGISNIFKHAGATELKLQIENLPDTIVFRLSDNGSGFDPSQDKPGHYGLKNMRQRAENAGVKIELKSEAKKGTKLRLEIDKKTLPKSGN